MRSELTDILRNALGIGVADIVPRNSFGRGVGYGRVNHAAPWRNRTACHETGASRAAHEELYRRCMLAFDWDASYGRMKVFRVTPLGAQALGVTLPKKLFDLIPRVAEPLKFAA